MRSTILALTLALTVACDVADPVTGCTTETVCARTCDTEPDDAEAWCVMRCGPCERGDDRLIPPLSYDGRPCTISERPVSEARPSTCWVTQTPWR